MRRKGDGVCVPARVCLDSCSRFLSRESKCTVLFFPSALETQQDIKGPTQRGFHRLNDKKHKNTHDNRHSQTDAAASKVLNLPNINCATVLLYVLECSFLRDISRFAT